MNAYTRSAALLLGACLFTTNLASAQRFIRAPQYSQGDTGRDAIAADFNGDGNPDLAFMGASYPGTLSIRLGKGNGTFIKGQTLTLDQNDHGERMVSGDWNGDGVIDLAVTSFIYRHIFLLLGNGDGTFTAGATLDVGEDAEGIATGDLNGDGIADLVTGNFYTSSVSVLLGLGGGNFAAPQTYSTNIVCSTGGVTLGDFNGDGKLDVAAVSVDPYDGTGYLDILLGNGDGTLGRPTYINTLFEPSTVIADDFNHDGVLDLAIAGGGVAIHIGKGDGTFRPEQLYSTASNNFGLAAADLNGDGNLDLLPVSSAISNNMSVLLGNSDGTFKNASQFGTGPCPYTVAVADFNKDGKLDAAFPETCDDNFTLLLGDGTGKFMTRRDFTMFSTADRLTPDPIAMAAAYLDGDKNLDLVIADKGNDQVILLSGNKNGAFIISHQYKLNTKIRWTTVADLNADGKTDVITADVAANAVSILLGRGDGTLQNQVQYTTAPAPSFVVTGDVNGDGKPDILTASVGNSNFSVLLNTGKGFPAHIDYTTPTPNQLALGDFNGDGKLDVVAVSGAGTASVFLGQGDGTFTPGVTLTAGSNPVSVAVGDLNQDGKLDIVIANNGAATLSIFLGKGDGTFQSQLTSPAVSNAHLLLLGDFNGDGKLDAVSVNGTFNNDSVAALFLGKGNGAFQGAQIYTVSATPVAETIGDFNGDGAPDLVTVNDQAYNLSVLLNAGKNNKQGAPAGGGKTWYQPGAPQ